MNLLDMATTSTPPHSLSTNTLITLLVMGSVKSSELPLGQEQLVKQLLGAQSTAERLKVQYHVILPMQLITDRCKMSVKTEHVAALEPSNLAVSS